MKPRLIAPVALALLLLAPLAVAVPDQVPGMSALVKQTGTDQIVKFRFPIAPDDPGSYTYNLTLDAGAPVVFSDVETAFSGTRAGGLISFQVEISGATDIYDAFVNAYDGSDNGTASCTVQFNTANLYDFIRCGSMAPTYVENYCLNRDSADNFGFSWQERVNLVVATAEGDRDLFFKSTDKEAAYGGINLGGDTTEYEHEFGVRSGIDSASSKILFFFSQVNVEVSPSSVGDGAVAVKTSFSVPRTGAFATGYGAVFLEDGGDYEVKIFQNVGGTTTVLLQETWSAGISTNSQTEGAITFSPYQGVFRVALGNEFATFDIDDLPSTDPFHSFWITEYGGGGVFFTAGSVHDVDDGNGCLYSINAALGGAVAATGAPSNVQALEDFEGEGGFISAPTYPGIDIPGLADSLEITEEFTGYVWWGIGFAVLVVLGFFGAGRTGAAICALLAVPFHSMLGLNPLWAVVLIFMGSVAVAIMKKAKVAGVFT